jgi:hypothetical protein
VVYKINNPSFVLDKRRSWFQIRFKWTEDTIAVWDNRCTFHCAIVDYFEEGRRHGWRVTPTVSFNINFKRHSYLLTFTIIIQIKGWKTSLWS